MPAILPPSPSPAHLTRTPDRSKRVKDAKNEAQKEIEEYRKQKDDEFKEFEKKVPSHSIRTRPWSPMPEVARTRADGRMMYSIQAATRRQKKTPAKTQMSS